MCKKYRILVHLHLYYKDQIDYFLSKLKNIVDCDWDLYVTLTEKDNEVIQKLLAFKPDTQIVIVENEGYDVWPFINVIKSVNLDMYDFVIKLHTKNYRKKNNIDGIIIRGNTWRNSLVDTILKNKRYFKQVLKFFDKNPNIGTINKKFFNWRIYHEDWPEESYLLRAELERINMKSDYRYFNAGTMFITRASVFKFLQNIEFTSDMFKAHMKTGASGSLAHVYERIFSIAVDEAGYQTHVINHNLEILWWKLLMMTKYLLSIQKEPAHKVLIIFGIKFKFKRHKKIKILVCYHKKDFLIKNKIYVPILAGRSLACASSKDGKLSKDDFEWMLKNMIGDDTGDNISHLNRIFNECTAIYWAWKNYEKLGNPEYIGLNHYRRCFNIKIKKLDKILALNYFVQMTPQKILNANNLYEQWINLTEDWADNSYLDTVLNLCKQYSAELGADIENFFKSEEKVSWCNMFIMPKKEFFKYCEFIFPLLFYIQKNAPREDRALGMIAERFTSYYLNRLSKRKTAYNAWICDFKKKILK